MRKILPHPTKNNIKNYTKEIKWDQEYYVEKDRYNINNNNSNSNEREREREREMQKYKDNVWIKCKDTTPKNKTIGRTNKKCIDNKKTNTDNRKWKKK